MTGPHPAVARTRNAVRATLEGDRTPPPPGGVGEDPPDGVPGNSPDGASGDLPDGGLVLVACSGGPDSLALAAAAAFVAPRLGRQAGAVVVDHGLQPGSATVAAEAAATCRAFGLDPVEVVRVVVPDAAGGPGGPEARARTARYAALEDAARRLGAGVVLLGHTLDDQAETVLLGLARGAGTRSLAGMPAARGPLRRPFLGLRRADTEAACHAQGLQPWQDPTNTADDVAVGPRRSRVRTHVLPLLEDVVGPGVAEALARTADRLRDDAQVLEPLGEELRGRATLPGAPGEVVLDVAVLAAAPAALRHRALRRACLDAGSPSGALAFTHVAALDALVTRWRGQGPVHLPGGLAGTRACGRLTVRIAGATTGRGRPVDGRSGDSQTDD